MVNGGFGQPGDMQALAQHYWNAWGEAMRNAAAQGAAMPGFNSWGDALRGSAIPAAPLPGAHAWSDAVNWWSQVAHGGRSDADHALDQFNRQARQWFVRMQQVAAQFAGEPAGARQIVDAWKKALGAASENPFPEMFRGMGAGAMPGLQQWMDDASPWLESWRREANTLLSLPTFGLAREHQERLQALARAQIDYQQCAAAFNALLAKSGQRAFELFEDKLVASEEPGRQIATARALFDLWIDAAEEAYAETALSAEFREVYGALTNAQMRLRQGIQREVELGCAQLGMPTRSEMDSAHRKIAELQRELRRLRVQATARPERGVPAAADATTTAASKAPKKTPSRRKPGGAPGHIATVADDAGAAKKSPMAGAARKAAKPSAASAAKKASPVRSVAEAVARKSTTKTATSVAKKSAAKVAKRATNKAAKASGKAPARSAARKATARGALSGIPLPRAPGTERKRGNTKGGR